MIEIQDLLYQLRLSEQASTQLFEKRLGISLTRYQILLFLLEHSPCNQIAVQERLKIDQAALTRHFKILEKEGLVERYMDEENRRYVYIRLSQKGTCMTQKAKQAFINHLKQSFDRLPEEDLNDLKQAAQTTLNILKKLEP